ncbi:DUF1205 domain-containing protein [Herbidospora galbida]|uniref:DUF1205 domain-containing protein n=1 Tax=Herbidospora galbida TaxID=2575442 RepID=A0A4U3MDG4_9ACTN|nr:nucleotide disphospho-sugar-binding domain-containing protein [Herbidospora galbida]TKK87225.1 DUF1205 domain-containing protein [Herbidospora galbida]
MRVLFTTYPARTHFHAMVPLAWALRTAGHEVAVASQPHFAGEITRAGLPAVPVGSDRGLARVLEADPSLLEDARAGVDAPTGPPTWEDVKDEYSEAVTWWYRMENTPLIHPLVGFARAWRPDLVIWEPTTNAGAIAATAVGAAHARLMYTPDSFGAARRDYLRLRPAGSQVPDTLAAWLGACAARYGAGGFSEDLVTGHFTVDHFPASLRLDAGLTYLRTRYVPYGGPAVVPGWLAEPPERPRVAVTIGLDAFASQLRDLLAELAGLDVEVVATVPADRHGELAGLPGRVRLTPFVPLHALAQTCAVVVHHGGAGTLATTSACGVPQVVPRLDLDGDFDEPELVGALTAQGAGVAVAASPSLGRDVRDAVARLLGDPAARERAAALRAEMEALPSPGAAVADLERLTARFRS